MIGVICADSEKSAVREFFELFKTPWMFWESSGSCDVLIVTSAAARPASSTARLVIAFGATEMHDDASVVVSRGTRTHDAMLEVDDLRLPLYTGALTLAGGATTVEGGGVGIGRGGAARRQNSPCCSPPLPTSWSRSTWNIRWSRTGRQGRPR